MKFGIGFANTLPFTGPAEAADLARRAEAAGFESLWTVEHVVYPDAYDSAYPYAANGKMPMGPETPLPDPLIWLTWVAANTTTIRLATGIVILPQRNPLVLAKEVATLDALSGGRVELGIGVGWLREEFDALGIPWEQRGARTDEYVEALRAAWAPGESRFAGSFARFSGVHVHPKPVQPRLPVVVGGHTDVAARRAGRLGDGFFPAKGSVRRLRELFAVVDDAALEAGRDPGAIERTASHLGVLGADPLAAVEELASIGVERVIVPAFAFAKDRDALGVFGEQVIARAPQSAGPR